MDAVRPGFDDLDDLDGVPVPATSSSAGPPEQGGERAVAQDPSASTFNSWVCSTLSPLSPIRGLRFVKAKSHDAGDLRLPPDVLDDVAVADDKSSEETMESMLLRDIDAHFVRNELIGQGRCGVVYKMTSRQTNTAFAVKTVYQGQTMSTGEVEDEIGNSGEFDHPYIVKLHAFFREDSKYHMIMDYCSGGDLRQYCTANIMMLKAAHRSYDSGLDTKVAARFIYQMLSGLVFLHHHGFIHRDIKPENYLLVDRQSNAPLKLTDFGFSLKIGRAEKLSRVCGTVLYAAPEVLAKSYDQKADIWSLGVTAFGICTNRLPLVGSSEREYLDNIRAGNIQDAEKSVWRPHLSKLRRVVLKMLRPDPEERASAKDLLMANPWLKAYGKCSVQRNSCCLPLP